MEFKQIQELLKAVNKSNISEVSIKDGDFEITIKQQNTGEAQYIPVAAAPQVLQAVAVPQAAAPVAATTPTEAAPVAASSNSGTPIKSPMIGTFYRSSGPEKPAFVNVGDEVKVGQVICIVEAVSGRIVKVLVDDASPVEYDQPLFLVEPI